MRNFHPGVSVSSELRSLLDAQCDGTMSASMWERLSQLLCDEPNARAVYVLHMDQHAALLWHYRDGLANDSSTYEATDAAPAMPPAPTFFSTAYHGTIGFFSQELPFSLLIATVLTSFGLWVASLVYISGPEKIAKDSLSSPKSSVGQTLEIVGKITGMVDCKWADLQTETFNGANVLLDRKYALASGLMEITYDTGAKVILQGPVTYEVESKNAGFLSIGKLTGKVENKMAKGFSVRTPTAIVTDMGTEFGVEVNSSGECAARVFQGVIELRLSSNAGEAKNIRLTANQSARVKQDASGRSVITGQGEASPASFVRQEQFRQLTKRQQVDLAQDRKLRRQQFLADPALVVWYDFQRQETAPQILFTTVGSSRFDGKINGGVWTHGRLSGKQALEFDFPTCVKVDLPRTMSDMTLTTWLALRLIDGDFCGLLTSNDWNAPGKCCWEVNRHGEMLLRLCSDGGKVHSFWTPPLLSWREMGASRWRHFAVTLDASNRRVAFYLDGKKVRQERTRENVAVCFGSAEIGNCGLMQKKGQSAGFWGQMDELAIFARALKEQEIKELYKLQKQ